MNLCKDCAHALDKILCPPMDKPPSAAFWCARPGPDGEPAREPVNGFPIYPTCESERSNADRCGRDGKFFEPREAKKEGA